MTSLTEQEFKTKVRTGHRARMVKGDVRGVYVFGHYDMTGRPGQRNGLLTEEWIVEEPTPQAIAAAEERVKELVWRKWKELQ